MDLRDSQNVRRSDCRIRSGRMCTVYSPRRFVWKQYNASLPLRLADVQWEQYGHAAIETVFAVLNKYCFNLYNTTKFLIAFVTGTGILKIKVVLKLNDIFIN